MTKRMSGLTKYPDLGPTDRQQSVRTWKHIIRDLQKAGENLTELANDAWVQRWRELSAQGRIKPKK